MSNAKELGEGACPEPVEGSASTTPTDDAMKHIALSPREGVSNARMV